MDRERKQMSKEIDNAVEEEGASSQGDPAIGTQGNGGSEIRGSDETEEGQTGDPDTSAVERPDWIPEKFWDTEKKEANFQNMAKSYAELEKLRGTTSDKLKETWEEERLSFRPESADKYTLPENDAFDPELLAASPVVALWRNAAYEAGLPQEKFQSVMEEFAKTEIEKQTIFFEAEKGKLGENADARLESAGLWGRKIFNEPEELEAFGAMTTTASGIRAVEKLMKIMSDGGVSVESATADDTKDTIESIRALQGSKEYWSNQHRNPAVVKRVEDFFANQVK